MDNQGNYRRLFGNLVAFTFGTLSSKLIVFLMLPLYTYCLTTSEFGITDLVQTTVNLLLPVCYLSIGDTVLRFTLDQTEQPQKIFSNSLLIVVCSTIMIIGVSGILWWLGLKYVVTIAIILGLYGIQSFFGQFTKAIGQVGVFALNGSLLTLLTAVSNLVLMLWLQLGLNGFFWSIIGGLIISNSYLLLKVRLWKYVDFNQLSWPKLKVLLAYSLPLVPNEMAWWATNEINRYFVLYYLGASANGIFAVANKIPSIVLIVTAIFFQSWQISAIEVYGQKTATKFFSTVFSTYCALIFMVISSLLAVLKPGLHLLVSANFVIAGQYVPLLLIGAMYAGFALFVAQSYVAAKQPIKVLLTTLLGMIINVGLSIWLTPILGLVGTCLSPAFSFAVVWVYRLTDTCNLVRIEVNYRRLLLNHLIIFGQIVSLYCLNGWQLLGIELVFLSVSIWINRQCLLQLRCLLKSALPKAL